MQAFHESIISGIIQFKKWILYYSPNFHTFVAMKKYLNILILFVFLSVIFTSIYGQGKPDSLQPGEKKLGIQVIGNDTIYLAFLKDIYVFPPLKFTNKKQEEFYWRTVRDVKRALPFAKVVSSELHRVNYLLVDFKKESDRKKYLAKYEKEVFKKYEADLRKLTINQGRLLLKLIDRECNSTSYDLIRNYRGSVSAFFWQGVARIFGSNLKSEYDAKGNDKILERVIIDRKSVV